MYDRKLVFETLEHIEAFLNLLIEATAPIKSVNELLTSPTGMLILDGICMKLMVIGEDVKNLDKHSHKELLPEYPTIPWRKIMGMRDIIAHHYFEVDADRIFDILRNDIPTLLAVIRKMKATTSSQ